MRAIWKGAIAFGMVTIPVKLYTATEQKDVRLRMLCRKHEAPIQEKRVCTEGGEELAWDELARGYEVRKGDVRRPRDRGDRRRQAGVEHDDRHRRLRRG